MSASRHDPWPRILADLASWHNSRNRLAANRALTHIESWLRTRIPPIIRRRWSAEEIDDALQGFLERLLNQPLPTDIRKPGAYLQRAFRFWCADRYRRGKADVHEPWDESKSAQSVSHNPADRERLERAAQALDSLRVEDRVVIKLVDVPHALTWEELSWLAKKNGVSAIAIQTMEIERLDIMDLSLMFDPGHPSTTTKERRDRLERFRRRRSRAREKLRQSMEEAP